MNNIQKLSRFLKYLFYVGACLNVLIPFLVFTTDKVMRAASLCRVDKWGYHTDNLPVTLERYSSFSLGHKILVGLSAIPAAILYSIALLSIAKLLELYEKGEYFSEKTAKQFGNIGKFFIFSVLITFPQELLFTAITTLKEPSGQRFMSVGISNHDFSSILFALMIILVGWVMREAVKIKKDQDLTV
jgi:hypothetical protein